MTVFGVDSFGYLNTLFNSEDVDKDEITPPTFKEISGGNAIKEDLGSGGRWGEGGKSLTLMDEEHMYLVLKPGYELTIVAKDLESGKESTKKSSSSMPIVQVGGINSVVRVKQFKTPEGDVFDYSTMPTL